MSLSLPLPRNRRVLPAPLDALPLVDDAAAFLGDLGCTPPG